MLRLPLPLRPLCAAVLIAWAPTAWSATFYLSTGVSLADALASAGNGDTIRLTGNVTLTSADLPALQKNITIEGNGYTLSGGTGSSADLGALTGARPAAVAPGWAAC